MTAMEHMGGFIRRIAGLPLNILDGISRALGHGTPRRNTRLPQLQQQQDEIPIVTEEWFFLNLHAPEEPGTDPFCCNTLRSQLVIEFLDANFVSWGAVANRGEGFEMALALRASSFPFCAVIAPASGKTIAVLKNW